MEALATGYGLIEGPVWAPGRGLYFSDVPNGGVHLLSPSGTVSLAIPHRKGIGAGCLQEGLRHPFRRTPLECAQAVDNGLEMFRSRTRS